LRVNLPDEVAIDRVLQSLPPSYKGFVMNYNMQGVEKTLPELFVMLKVMKVEIKKEHQVLMVKKTTSFKKGKGKKGKFKNNGKPIVAPLKKPKAGSKPETKCFYYCKGMATGSETAPSTWQIRRLATSTKVYLIYMVLMCTLLVLVVAPGYLILVRLLIFVTRNRSCGINEY
jgi:hypothetical protein